ncbi:MAG: alpha/beta fold hydrolase [Pseudomonadota bacterium]
MQGQTWVLLRGLVREQRHWEGFPALLAARLPAGSRVLCIDLPGNGVHWREASPSTLAGMLAGARADLAAQGVTGPLSLLSLSLGGMTAFEWMSRYPAEVERAALINTSLSAFSPFWERLRPRNYPAILRHVLFSRDRTRLERMILAITTNLVADREYYVQRWAGYAADSPVSLRNSVVQLLAAARYSAPERAPACPVLLLNGGNDRLVSPRCSDRIADGMGLPLERHPTAGHDLALDAGDWLAARVAAFAVRTARP